MVHIPVLILTVLQCWFLISAPTTSVRPEPRQGPPHHESNDMPQNNRIRTTTVSSSSSSSSLPFDLQSLPLAPPQPTLRPVSNDSLKQTPPLVGSSSTPTSSQSNSGPSDIKTIFQIPEEDDFWWLNETRRGIQPTVSTSSHLLRIYVYDNLPPSLSSGIEQYMRTLHVFNASAGSETELLWIRLFRSYPGRTYNASEADLFVVPYPIIGDCEMHLGSEPSCRNMSPTRISKDLMPALHHYIGRERQHLFLAARDPFFVHRKLMRKPLIMTFGPRHRAASQPGHIVAPIYNDSPLFQPSVLIQKNTDLYWTRDRTYSFVELSGKTNPSMRGSNDKRKYRRLFAEAISQGFPPSSERQLVGKPFVTNNKRKRGLLRAMKLPLHDLYGDSVFCPVLPGDAPWQRRLFDVISSGCLPVVLEWNVSDVPGNKTWWQPPPYNPRFPETFSPQQSLPFWKGLVGGDPDTEIDYESFAVRIPMEIDPPTSLSIVHQTISEFLANRTDEIRERQQNMRPYGLAFSFGLGRDAHRYDDGFARIVRQLKYYLATSET